MQRKKILLFFIIFSFVFVCVIFQKYSLAATFVESFSDTDYIDETNTTADWDTSSEAAHLVNGEWRQMDGATSPYVFNEEVVTGMGAAIPEIIHDANNQPLIVFHESNGLVLRATKWTVGAGTSVCGVGVTDCWTDLAGNTKGLHNSIYDFPGSDKIEKKRIARLSSGYPAVIFAYYNASEIHYELHYIQWTPNAADGVCSSGNACWTNAAETVEGSEKISNNSITLSTAYKSFDLVLDQYGHPNIMWDEFDETNLTYHYTRWNGSSWTYADRSTTGKQQLTTKVSSDSADLEFIIENDIIYIVLRYDDYNYVGKWTGSNWVDLADNTFTNYTGMTIFKASNNGSLGIGQNKKRNYLMVADNKFYLGVSSFTTGTADNYLSYWDDVADTWKYVNGITIGNNQTAIDNMNELFNGESWDLHELFLVSLSTSSKTNNILLLLVNYDGADSEMYFSQWDGNQWLQPDGETAGYEVATNLSYGGNFIDYSGIDIDNYGRPIFCYPDRGYIDPNKLLPFYFSRFNGEDITGVNGYTANRDFLADDGQGLGSGLFWQDLYFNRSTEEIYLAGLTGDGGMLITKFFANKYPDQDQDLVSDTIATAHTGSIIDTATLTAVDSKPAGTAIIYEMSADGGSNWETVSSGVEHTFTNTGSDLRWQANLTSSSEDTTPLIQYLYVDVDAKTMDTSGDITITGEVEPSLTLTLSNFTKNDGSAAADYTCEYQELDASIINGCTYRIIVETNATSGYTSYIRELGAFDSGSHSLTDVSGGGIVADTEAYGVLTTSDGTLDVVQIPDSEPDGDNDIYDCAAAIATPTVAVSATALTSTDKSIATATGPVDATTGQTTICHGVSISGSTPAGNYSHDVLITVVGNF